MKKLFICLVLIIASFANPHDSLAQVSKDISIRPKYIIKVTEVNSLFNCIYNIRVFGSLFKNC